MQIKFHLVIFRDMRKGQNNFYEWVKIALTLMKLAKKAFMNGDIGSI